MCGDINIVLDTIKVWKVVLNFWLPFQSHFQKPNTIICLQKYILLTKFCKHWVKYAVSFGEPHSAWFLSQNLSGTCNVAHLKLILWVPYQKKKCLKILILCKHIPWLMISWSKADYLQEHTKAIPDRNSKFQTPACTKSKAANTKIINRWDNVNNLGPVVQSVVSIMSS